LQELITLFNGLLQMFDYLIHPAFSLHQTLNQKGL